MAAWDIDQKAKAIHEAGHAVIGAALGIPVKAVDISGRHGGHTELGSWDDNQPETTTGQDLLNEITMTLAAAAAAERLIIGHGTTGSTDDLRQATAVAYTRLSAGLDPDVPYISPDGIPFSLMPDSLGVDFYRAASTTRCPDARAAARGQLGDRRGSDGPVSRGEAKRCCPWRISVSTTASRCPMPATPNRLATLATALAALAALAGLAISGLYVDAPNWIQQAQGTDLATLFLAVPVLIAGLWTASRGSVAGRLAVVAGLLYLVYNYAIFAFSVAMNPLTALYIAVFGLSLWSLLLAGRSAVEGAEAMTERLNRRTAGGLLVGVGVMFGLLWLTQIAGTSMTGVLPPDLTKAGLSSNPVYALDLAFFLPLCVIAGVGLLRRNGAAAFAFPMLVWVPLMGAGVVGGMVLMATAGDQSAVPIAVVITALGVVSAILAVLPIVRPRAGTAPVAAARAPAR